MGRAIGWWLLIGLVMLVPPITPFGVIWLCGGILVLCLALIVGGLLYTVGGMNIPNKR